MCASTLSTGASFQIRWFSSCAPGSRFVRVTSPERTSHSTRRHRPPDGFAAPPRHVRRSPRGARACAPETSPTRASSPVPRVRTWVAQAGWSAATTSTPPRRRTGRTWRATAGPAISSHREKTADSDAAGAAGTPTGPSRATAASSASASGRGPASVPGRRLRRGPAHRSRPPARRTSTAAATDTPSGRGTAVVSRAWPAGSSWTRARGPDGVELGEHVVEQEDRGPCPHGPSPAGGRPGAGPGPRSAARPGRPGAGRRGRRWPGPASSRCGPDAGGRRGAGPRVGPRPGRRPAGPPTNAGRRGRHADPPAAPAGQSGVGRRPRRGRARRPAPARAAASSVPAVASRSSQTSRVVATSALARPPGLAQQRPALAQHPLDLVGQRRRPPGPSRPSASSRRSRRRAGPPWTTPRSSGLKTVTGTASARSRRARTGWRLTWARERPEVATSASTSTGAPLAGELGPQHGPLAAGAHHGLRGRPRNDRWVPRYATASRTVVLPVPFGPGEHRGPLGVGLEGRLRRTTGSRPGASVGAGVTAARAGAGLRTPARASAGTGSPRARPPRTVAGRDGVGRLDDHLVAQHRLDPVDQVGGIEGDRPAPRR